MAWSQVARLVWRIRRRTTFGVGSGRGATTKQARGFYFLRLLCTMAEQQPRIDMWDGVTYVQPSRRPIIHEGTDAARLVVNNVGPGVIDLLVWVHTGPGQQLPDMRMRLPPGNTRSVSGPMIGVGFADDQSDCIRSPAPFAAVAWRVGR